MSIDTRTRLHKHVRSLTRDEIFDTVFPDAIAVHGDLAGRGLAYKQLPPLGFEVDGVTLHLHEAGGVLAMGPGIDSAGVVAVLAEDALSDLVQDTQSTMGLAMTSRVRIAAGSINDWIAWEPVLRALLDGRKVHETGDVTFTDLDGDPLDLSRTFTVDDDRDEIAHFLEQAGFLHLRGIFEETVMAEIGADIDEWIGRATPDDGESWWAETDDGAAQAVRVLFFYEKSNALREAVADERYQWIGDLTGDGHRHRGDCRGARQAARHRSRSLRPAVAQGLRPGQAFLHVQRIDLWHLGDRRGSGERCPGCDSRQPPRQHHRNRSGPEARPPAPHARDPNRRRHRALQ